MLSNIPVGPGPDSKWRKMNHIQFLQHGLEHGLHKREGWLWKALLVDGIVPDTREALRERCYNAFEAQKIYIMAQQQIMPEGWDPRKNPFDSVKQQKGTGKFMSLQRVKNPVPTNILTQAYLRHVAHTVYYN
jgi:hypothetical protein